MVREWRLALRLPSDKTGLLALTPPSWRPAFLTLPRLTLLLQPPIDLVARDCTSAEPEPLLLEGNGDLVLLVPQILQHLQKSTM